MGLVTFPLILVQIFKCLIDPCTSSFLLRYGHMETIWSGAWVRGHAPRRPRHLVACWLHMATRKAWEGCYALAPPNQILVVMCYMLELGARPNFPKPSKNYVINIFGPHYIIRFTMWSNGKSLHCVARGLKVKPRRGRLAHNKFYTNFNAHMAPSHRAMLHLLIGQTKSSPTNIKPPIFPIQSCHMLAWYWPV